MKVIVLSASLCLTFTAIASSTAIDSIYGKDNRLEIYQAPESVQILAKATAAMVDGRDIRKGSSNSIIHGTPLVHAYDMCHGERFNEQPTTAYCSAFLIAPDLMVTAGHCVKNLEDCNEANFLFDYKIEKDTKKAKMRVSNSKLYKCKEIVETKLGSNGFLGKYDYAVVRLDRKVEGVKPLKYRKSGKIKMNDNIFVIGHPTGLPSKYAPGAYVQHNSLSTTFMANLDTFGGNSGSAVFNTSTQEVEGILVAGAVDYNRPQACASSAKYGDTIYPGFTGESVSRIGSIRALYKRDKLVSAIKIGDAKKVETILEDISNKKILSLGNENGVTPIDFANKGSNTRVKELLNSFTR